MAAALKAAWITHFNEKLVRKYRKENRGKFKDEVRGKYKRYYGESLCLQALMRIRENAAKKHILWSLEAS